MVNNIVKLRGEAYWARVQEDNYDSYNGLDFYKITVALDDESWDKFNKAGFLLEPKPVSKDEPDKLGITFRRTVEPKLFKDKKTGKITELGGGAPIVRMDAEEFDGLIGNGSVVEVVVEKFPLKTRKGYGHRLSKVRIIDLVPYEAPEDDDEEEVEEETPFKPDEKKKPAAPTSTARRGKTPF